jgi:hypothetical protein
MFLLLLYFVPGCLLQYFDLSLVIFIFDCIYNYGFLSHNHSLLTRDCYRVYLLLMNNVLEQLANHDTSRRFDISRQRQIVLSIFSLVKVRSLKFMHD